MSKRILLVVASFLGLATLGVGAAGAGVMHGFPPCRMSEADREAHFAFVVDKALDVAEATDAQSDEIHQILADARPSFEAHHDAMKAHHEALRTVLTAPTVDRDALEALRLEAVAGVGEMSVLVADLVGDVSEVLSQEQRQKLADFAEEMHPE